MDAGYSYCHLCDKKMKESELQSHEESKRHIAAVAKRKSREEAAVRTVFIQNIQDMEPQGRKEKLEEYFSAFGNVENVRVTEYCAFVQFEDASSPGKVLSRKVHICQGVRLPIRKYVFKEPVETLRHKREFQELEEQKKSEEQVMLSLITASDIADQIKKLSQQCRLNKHERRRRENVCRELTRLFSPFFDFCQVQQFGSSINGFGISGCDLDIYIDLNGSGESTSSGQEKPCVALPFTKGLRTLQFFIQGPVGAAELYNADPLDLVKMLSRILMTKRGEFLEIQSIPSSRCPVCRFIHRKTGLKCDLSLNNRVALLNSRLLRLYSKEPRVHEVVVAVRMWAKQQNIATTQQLSHLLTSYATTWLVLFYLQSLDPPVVPKVTELINLIPGASVVNLQDFDCLSVPLDAQLPKSSNTTSSVDLLRGFFDFYTDEVKLETDALVTRDNQIYPRHVLKTLPAYKKCNLGFITVIDPFILNHNVTQTINEKVKDRLMGQLQMAVKVVTEWSDININKEESWGLAELLVPRIDPATVTRAAKAKSKKRNRTGAKTVEGGAALFSFELAAESNNSAKTALHCNSAEKDLIVHKMWFNLVQDMVVKVLAWVFFVRIKDDGTLQTESNCNTEEKCTGLDQGSRVSSPTVDKVDTEEDNFGNDIGNTSMNKSLEVKEESDEEYEDCNDDSMEEQSESNNIGTTAPQQKRWVITEDDPSDEDCDEFSVVKNSVPIDDSSKSPTVVRTNTEQEYSGTDNSVTLTTQKRRWGVMEDSSNDECEPNLNHRRLKGAEPTTRCASDPPDNSCVQDMEVEHREDSSKNLETPAKGQCPIQTVESSTNNKDKIQLSQGSEQPEQGSSHQKEIVKEKDVPDFRLSCLLYLIMWRDRVRVRKLLKSSKNIFDLDLEHAVSSHYLSQHAKSGFVPEELDVLLRSETAIAEGLSIGDFVSSSVPDNLIADVKFPKVRFSCTVSQVSDDPSKVEVSMRPDTSTSEDLQYFKLFFDSFQSVLCSLVKSQVIDGTL